MTAITREIVVDAPPERVWDILADLPAYPEWNRSTRIVPEPDKPDLITYGLTAVRPNGKELAWTLMGRMLTRRRPELITWRLGFTGFLSVAMSYVLTPKGPGTQVMFKAEVAGVVPAVFRNHFPNLLPEPMAGTLQALKRRAELGKPRPSAKPPLRKPKHGGPPRRR